MNPKSLAVCESELVILALHDLENRNSKMSGSTPEDITEYIAKKFSLDPDNITPNVHSALMRGLTFGILSEKRGRFKLEDVPEVRNLDSYENYENLSAIVFEKSKDSIRDGEMNDTDEIDDAEMDETCDCFQDLRQSSSERLHKV